MDADLKRLLRSIDNSLHSIVNRLDRLALAVEKAVDYDPLTELVEAIQPSEEQPEQTAPDVVGSTPNPDDLPIDQWLKLRDEGRIS